jgi:hypothetical protein
VEAARVEACYEQQLASERIPSDDCPAGCVIWDTEGLSLTISAKPGRELHRASRQHLAAYPQAPAYQFPPAEVIREIYRTLLGSIHSRTFRGYAYMMGTHDRPERIWKSTTNAVMACLACCFGELDETTRAAKRRPRISGALNRHLLSPYGITELPESWSDKSKVREDVKEVGAMFKRASYLWQHPKR